MKKLVFTYLFIVANLVVINAQNQINPDFNLTKSGIAIQGYDPVSYFTTNKAMKGDTAFVATYEGATYRFADANNKATFLKSPAKYVPTYGGWCAYAMGEKGEKVEINPETFKILDSKLYLFYNAKKVNTLTLWNSNEATLKAKAEANWSNYSDKP